VDTRKHTHTHKSERGVGARSRACGAARSAHDDGRIRERPVSFRVGATHGLHRVRVRHVRIYSAVGVVF